MNSGSMLARKNATSAAEGEAGACADPVPVDVAATRQNTAAQSRTARDPLTMMITVRPAG
jgi:hypothetical protein